MNIVFFGSDEFALTHLKALIDSDHVVVGCVTQPDRAAGRHLKVIASPIKTAAQEAGIPVLQPADLLDAACNDTLKKFGADIFVVVAYGNFLPGDVLAIPRLFCINVHGSLLPKYRGAAPINWAIVNGEATTGLTIFKINEQMDSGDIIAQCEHTIADDDTAIILKTRMAHSGAEMLVEVLARIEAGDYELIKQNDTAASRAPKLTKQHGLIDWNKSAVAIHNQVRGLVPWPSAYTYYTGKLLKIYETRVVEQEKTRFSPGDVVEVTKDGFCVMTGQGVLCIKKVHLESAKPMDAASFVAGHKIGIGFRLGN